MQWETVIGLEIHAQLSTQSKIFSGSATSFGAEPNAHASLVDLGMPGTLPVINRRAVELVERYAVTDIILGITYAVLMTLGAYMVRVPAADWRPAGWEPSEPRNSACDRPGRGPRTPRLRQGGTA